jgi:hypothetical protein
MYEGSSWAPIAEVTIRHGKPFYFVALPVAVALVSVLAHLAKKADVGAVLCHTISILGLLSLGYAVYVIVTRTTFHIYD